MQTLTVDLGDRSYPIYIGRGLIKQAELFNRHIPGKAAMVVSNTTVAPLYLDTVSKSIQRDKLDNSILPDGEAYKNLTHLDTIFTDLLTTRHDRNTTLIALGGGVVGDMTGFAAASYQRGVHFIQVPTTLLSQVDSSVGGKTGVNHPLGKNMIGAFYQPRCVIIDTDTLNTLPDRELSAGIAEIIKYGLIGDIGFLAWLEDNMDALLQRDPDALAYAIHRSCENKARIVAEDEKESGKRALLNLGHTFGHAIETGMGYGVWLHGEAVATGMVMAAELSQAHGWIDESDVARTRDLIQRANLPIDCPVELRGSKMRDLMAVDKKVLDGQLRLVLLKSLGNAIVSADFDADKLAQVIAA